MVDEVVTSSTNNEEQQQEEVVVLREIEEEEERSETTQVEAEQKSQQRKPSYTLSFENLSAHVSSTSNNTTTASTNYLQKTRNYLNLGADPSASFYTFHNISGYIKSSETLLVLGPSGCGKSTLLQALCGRLNHIQGEICGSLYINGIPTLKDNKEIDNHWNEWKYHSCYVSSKDNEHCPFLTVYETFYFAAECCKYKNETPSDIDKRVTSMINMLGLTNCINTIIGDENIRGISGGQRRRVTVGEMLLNTNSLFFMCLDNITDGLASTDSIKLISNIVDICKEHNIGCVITLTQPSDEIVTLFDKLLVLSDVGTMNYFGNVDESLLRQTFGGDSNNDNATSTTICDLVLNQSIQHSLNPLTDMQLLEKHEEEKDSNIFINTDTYKELMKTLYELRINNVNEDHEHEHKLPWSDKDENKDQLSSNSYIYQIKILSKRRIKLITRNPMTYMRPFLSLFFGLLMGSLYRNIENNLLGVFAREGFLYGCLYLALLLATVVTVPAMFRERQTLLKHLSAGFYNGSVAYITNAMLDIPICLLESTILVSCSYQLISLNPGANHFFYFLLVVTAMGFMGESLARFLSCVFHTQLTTVTVTALCLFLYGTVGCFAPIYGDMEPIIQWLTWLSPLAYAFEGLVINECDGLEFYTFSTKDKMTDVTVDWGYTTGDEWLEYMTLPRNDWNLQVIQYFNLSMIIVIAIIFDLMGLVCSELSRGWFYNTIRRSQPRIKYIDYESTTTTVTTSITSTTTNVEGENLNVPLLTATAVEEEEEQLEYSPKTLSVVNLSYTVKLSKISMSKDNEITLLHNMAAHFKRGRMTAIMGVSGAGKTTLLDVIAGYKTAGIISGEILVDGKPKYTNWKKISGYAEQTDIFNPFLSVLETLQFTATFRLPSHVNKQEVIKTIISLMGLQSYTNMLVGKDKVDEGLTRSIRKRLTIANELVSQPKILFLDEPTTGLDSFSAALIMKEVSKTTKALGLITLATIHQPSKQIFENFDDLLLIANGGHIVYTGQIGSTSTSNDNNFTMNSDIVMNYFLKLSGTNVPPPLCNPADFVLGVVEKVDRNTLISTYKSSSSYKELMHEIEETKKIASSELSDNTTTTKTVGLNATQRFITLTKRHFVCNWRDPGYSYFLTFLLLSTTLYVGVLYFQVSDDLLGAFDAISAFNYLVYLLSLPMNVGSVQVVEDRAVMYREVMGGNYSRFMYIVTKFLADFIFHVVNSFFMTIIGYYMIGFRQDGFEYILYFYLVMLMSIWMAMSIGQIFALTTPNEEFALGLCGMTLMLSIYFEGFVILPSYIPDEWEWAYWSDFFRYINQGLSTNELENRIYTFSIELCPLPGLWSSVSSSNLPSVAASSTLHGVTGNFITNLVGTSATSCLQTTFNYLNPTTATTTTTAIARILTSSATATTTILTNVTNTTSQLAVDTMHTCMMEKILPSAVIESIDNSSSKASFLVLIEKFIYAIVKKLIHVVPSLSGPTNLSLPDPCITFTLGIPAESILWLWDWAEFEDGELVAPYKWFYCFTSLVLMTVGVEILKIVAVYTFTWTKR